MAIDEESCWVERLKRKPFFSLVLFMGYFMTGLFIFPLQAIAYVLVRPWSLCGYRKVSYYTSIVMFLHKVFLLQWWANTEIQLFIDPRDLKHMGKEQSILLFSHKYETDVLVVAAIINYVGISGNTRAIAKKSLQYLPIIGWIWKLQEYIFVDRNFETDKTVLEKQLTSLLKHSDPINLLLFAEGTRFTRDKHQVSMLVAKEKGMQELKHHLLPRTHGFVKCTQILKSKNVPAAVYDGLVVMETGEDGNAVSFSLAELLKGYGSKVKVVLRRYPVNNISGEDAECAQWLYERYQEKDQLFENYVKTGNFAGRDKKFVNNDVDLNIDCNFVKLPKPLKVLVIVGTLNAACVICILWAMIKLLINGNMYVIGAAAVVAYGLDKAFRMLNDVTKIEKGSLYGK